MKLIQHSSKWGNLFRHRYYIDGKRVSRSEFDATYNSLLKQGKKQQTKNEGRLTWYRLTFNFEEESNHD